MALAGNLATMELPDILQWLAQGCNTGTLVVVDAGVEKSIFFSDGVIVSSTSSNPKEYLGHFLVSHGYITEAQLTAAVRQQRESRILLGKILVDQGALSEADLRRMLVLKAEESIFELFNWKEGEFRFLDGELPDWEMVPISLGVTRLVLEGMQRADEWTGIREAIPVAQCVPVLLAPVRDEVKLEDAEQALVQLIDDDRTIEELCLQTHASEYFVCRTLYRLLQAGKLKVVRPRVMASDEPTATSSEALIDRAWRHIGGEAYDLALRHLRAAGQLDPSNAEVVEEVARAEAHIRTCLKAEGLYPDAVPRLASSLDGLDGQRILPQEGFLLSRIDGVADVGAIVAISPIPEADVLVLLWRLQRAGSVELLPADRGST
jgi:hypothetical protein